MNHSRSVLFVFAALFLSVPAAFSQAAPTATQGLQISTFGAVSGVFTGLLGGRNISVTAGADLAFRPIAGLYPSLEVRGTYPFHPGQIASQKYALGGIRIDHPYGRLHPYINFLAGRGEIDYQNGGFTIGSSTYLSTPSNVYSPGGGVDIDLAHHLAFKADYQFQLWSTPVTSSGSIHANAISLGVVYHFDFNRSYRRERHPATTGEPHR